MPTPWPLRGDEVELAHAALNALQVTTGLIGRLVSPLPTGEWSAQLDAAVELNTERDCYRFYSGVQNARGPRVDRGPGHRLLQESTKYRYMLPMNRCYSHRVSIYDKACDRIINVEACSTRPIDMAWR